MKNCGVCRRRTDVKGNYGLLRGEAVSQRHLIRQLKLTPSPQGEGFFREGGDME